MIKSVLIYIMPNLLLSTYFCFSLVAQILSLCYNLSSDRQYFKVTQNYHNFALVALV